MSITQAVLYAYGVVACRAKQARRSPPFAAWIGYMRLYFYRWIDAALTNALPRKPPATSRIRDSLGGMWPLLVRFAKLASARIL